MVNRLSSLGPKPMSIAEISTASKRYEYDPRIRLKVWLRTADMLLREASIYQDDGNLEQSYMLLMRYIDLVVEKLRTHPEAKSKEYKHAVVAALRVCPEVVDKLEALKPKINRRREAWETLAKEQEASAAFGGDGFMGHKRRPSDLSESDPAVAGRTKTLAAKDHGDIPVKLFRREIRRRDDARRSGRERGARGYSESDRMDDDEAEQRRRMEDTRRKMNNSQDDTSSKPRKLTKSRSPARSFNTQPPISNYAYPSIKKPQPFTYDERPRGHDQSYKAEMLPPVPVKEAIMNTMSYDNQMRSPSRPDKVLRDESPFYGNPTSPVDDTSEYTFKPSAYLENGNPLRCLFLPSDLRSTFLSIARKNTQNNLETCGMLCGTLMSNALFVSRLVIPEQEGSSDTCEMTNENALFEYCDSEDLIVLGWIHTHPTQSCFMSSRDLHTHCGFQVMMPEAIAIVCAPSRQPSYGVFRLTDPPGMKNVLNCSNPGLFHPHPENDTYTDALKPGHVYETHGLEFKTVDLRPSGAR